MRKLRAIGRRLAKLRTVNNFTLGTERQRLP
jgi:hypothetical protein